MGADKMNRLIRKVQRCTFTLTISFLCFAVISCGDKLFQSTIVIENRSNHENDVITELLLGESTDDYDYIVWRGNLNYGESKSVDIDSGEYYVQIAGTRTAKDGIAAKKFDEIDGSDTEISDHPVEFRNADTITFYWDGKNLKIEQ